MTFHDSPCRCSTKYGTPLRLTYLPKISSQIQKAKGLFADAIRKLNYQGSTRTATAPSRRTSASCSKRRSRTGCRSRRLRVRHSDHPRAARGRQAHKDTHIVCNGFKRDQYRGWITDLLNDGFRNCTPVLDNLDEIEYYKQHLKTPAGKVRVGMRLASDEEPKFQFYTSRLGIRYDDAMRLYLSRSRRTRASS